MSLSRFSFSRTQQGIALALLGTMAFSCKAILVKLAYKHGVNAITLVMLRMVLALPFFLAMAWWKGRGQPALTKPDLLGVVGLGVTGYYLASYLDFAGLVYVSATIERLILYLNPTLVLILGWVWWKKTITRQQIQAMALSYGGIVLVFAHELYRVPTQNNNLLLGGLLIFLSASSYAVYLSYSGELVKRLGALRLVGWATSVACGLCMGHFLITESQPWQCLSALPAVVWQLSVVNAVLCTVLPVVAVMMAVVRIGSDKVAQASMLGPISTIGLGVWLLDEHMNAFVVAGGALVLVGVYWMNKGVKK